MLSAIYVLEALLGRARRLTWKILLPRWRTYRHHINPPAPPEPAMLRSLTHRPCELGLTARRNRWAAGDQPAVPVSSLGGIAWFMPPRPARFHSCCM